MKRRDFIKLSSSAGIAGMAGRRFDSFAVSGKERMTGFDLHPFIREHPEAVFVCLTSVKEKTDAGAIYDAGFKLSGEMFVKTTEGRGFSNSTRIVCKPNWTAKRIDPADPTSHLGITTDNNFIEGFLNGVKATGPGDIYLRECAAPRSWDVNGYTSMCARNNFNLRDLSSKDFWDLDDEIIFKKVDGTVFREIGFMAPVNAPDTFLINLAKFKAHSMGITGAIKNLQGTTGRRFHQFCGGYRDVFKLYDKRYHPFFQPDYLARIAELHKKHIEAGIPRWDTEIDNPPFRGGGGGFYMEHWVQRMLDAFSATPTGINIVEGIYGRDGDGFAAGPHEGKAKDYMSNNIIFGTDAFRVDIILHWLAGHEPGNFGLFHIEMERGFSDVLDPFDIPVYLWENGSARKVDLDTLKRTPLLTPYLRKNTRGDDEERYHMCDEPFDYEAWKSTGKIIRYEPSIKAIGTDAADKIVMDMKVPEKGDVYVEILNSDGEVVWRMYADDLEPGVHQVVWDGFSSPGLYTTYVKGMEWDAENEMVIYT
ncbi:MAG TPA: DUF362 domain-containing protein [Bacteroidales bacterium]|nr:DUF362 domain-containing protein [Bacteroidales bacterium]